MGSRLIFQFLSACFFLATLVFLSPRDFFFVGFSFAFLDVKMLHEFLNGGYRVGGTPVLAYPVLLWGMGPLPVGGHVGGLVGMTVLRRR